MKLIQLIITLGILLINPAVLAEQQPEQQLKSFLQKTRTLKADFKQVTLDQYGNPAQTSYGVFYLRRPGMFRWDYQKPFHQEIVSSQDKVWFYDADLEQVTVRSLDDSLGSTPALLLSGTIDLEDKFDLSRQGRDQDMYWIKLTPKDEDSGFKSITIGMQAGKLAGMELSDNFGQLTRIYFSNLRQNITLPANLFTFKIPEGADVLQQ